MDMVENAQCPVCGHMHVVVYVFGIRILVCSIIKDLIYLDKVRLIKETRLLVKRELGLDNF